MDLKTGPVHATIELYLKKVGHAIAPISSNPSDPERYQTGYATHSGSQPPNGQLHLRRGSRRIRRWSEAGLCHAALPITPRTGREKIDAAQNPHRMVNYRKDSGSINHSGNEVGDAGTTR
jgi:hypothetical protein